MTKIWSSIIHIVDMVVDCDFSKILENAYDQARELVCKPLLEGGDLIYPWMILSLSERGRLRVPF